MTRNYALLTIVGGHFLLGWRLRGIAFLVALGLLPFLTPVIVILIFPSAARTQNEFVFPFAYLALLIAVWLASFVLFLKTVPSSTIQENTLSQGKRREAAVASLFAWAFVGLGIQIYVVSPLLVSATRDGSVTIFGWSTSYPQPHLVDVLKPLPLSDGDLVIRGRLVRNGIPLPNQEIRLLFALGYSSPAMRTDDKGEFSLRLPAGDWRDAGPLIGPKGQGSGIRYEIEGPYDYQTRTFHVVRGSPSRSVSMLVTVQQ